MTAGAFKRHAASLLASRDKPLTAGDVRLIEAAVAHCVYVPMYLIRRAAGWRNARAQGHRPPQNQERDFIIRYLLLDVAPRCASLSCAQAKRAVHELTEISIKRIEKLL